MINRQRTFLAVVAIALATSSCTRYVYPIKGHQSSLLTPQEREDILDEQRDSVLITQRDSLEIEEVVEVDTLEQPYIDVVEEEVVPTRVEMPDFTKKQSSEVRLAEQRYEAVDDVQILLKDADSNSFHYPTDKELGFVTSPYGWRHGRMHSGIDLKVNQGDNIYSAFDGKVRLVKYQRSGWGYHVVVRHYNGLETLYSHASKILVEVNQEVKAGDVIALGGRTGRASGTHLHFEVRLAGETMNPAMILDTKNKTCQNKNIYLTKRNGRLFVSNDDSKLTREAEIISQLSIKYHTVRSGDMLSKIAAKYGTTVTNLCRLNHISSSTTLSIGKRLIVRDGISVAEQRRLLEEAQKRNGEQVDNQHIAAAPAQTSTSAVKAATTPQPKAEVEESKPAPKKVDKEEIATSTYTIKRGDMLANIASRYNTTVEALCRLNNISSPKKIQIGQKIQIPSDGSEISINDNAPATINYTIQKNDMLGKLAVEFNTTVAKICALNGISTSTKLKIGQVLQIPTNSAQATSSSAAKYYEVKSGDVLGKIAERNNTTVSKICSLNGITSRSTLHPGQKLRVK